MKRVQMLSTSFLLIIALSATVYYSTRKSVVKDTLQKISLKEKEQLASFFEELIMKNSFGYTIFGDKPVSVANFNNIPLSFGLTLTNNFDLIIRNGSLVWQNHKHLFPLKNFILKFENKGKYRSVIIINVPLFRNKVNEHIDLFKKILGKNATANSLLKTLIKQDSIYDDTINNSEILAGILYGFGKQNAILYDRFNELVKAIEEGVPPPFKDNYDYSESKLEPLLKHYLQIDGEFKKDKQYSSRTVTPSDGFKNIQEELEFIDAKNSTNNRPHFKHFPLPSFRYDLSDEETKHIMQNFITTRKQLLQIYSSREFLETTLKKLTGET